MNNNCLQFDEGISTLQPLIKPLRIPNRSIPIKIFNLYTFPKLAILITPSHTNNYTPKHLQRRSHRQTCSINYPSNVPMIPPRFPILIAPRTSRQRKESSIPEATPRKIEQAPKFKQQIPEEGQTSSNRYTRRTYGSKAPAHRARN